MGGGLGADRRIEGCCEVEGCWDGGGSTTGSDAKVASWSTAGSTSQPGAPGGGGNTEPCSVLPSSAGASGGGSRSQLGGLEPGAGGCCGCKGAAGDGGRPGGGAGGWGGRGTASALGHSTSRFAGFFGSLGPRSSLGHSRSGRWSSLIDRLRRPGMGTARHHWAGAPCGRRLAVRDASGMGRSVQAHRDQQRSASSERCRKRCLAAPS